MKRGDNSICTGFTAAQIEATASLVCSSTTEIHRRVNHSLKNRQPLTIRAVATEKSAVEEADHPNQSRVAEEVYDGRKLLTLINEFIGFMDYVQSHINASRATKQCLRCWYVNRVMYGRAIKV